MQVHERIAQKRKELGLSAIDVANSLNVTRATVYRYESAEINKLPIQILEPIAKILQTTPGYLMGWEKEKERTKEELSAFFERTTKKLDESEKILLEEETKDYITVRAKRFLSLKEDKL